MSVRPELPEDEDFLLPGSGPEEHRLVACEQAAGQRLDKWLSVSLGDLSRARLQSLIRSGAVRIDGQTILDTAWKLKPGQTVTVLEPDKTPSLPLPQEIPLDILYEDEAVVVVNKPAGLVVHPGAGNPDGTVVNALLYHCKGRLSRGSDPLRPGIVHRLDKDTSGVLVAAKTDAAHEALAAQFAARQPERTYRALVLGTPCPLSGSIEGNIGRHPKNRQKMAVVEPDAGKPALTRYTTLKIFANGAVSLVECHLETGRTHQVRVHLGSRNLPLVGDPLYGRKSPPKACARLLQGFSRQALHALGIGFVHPSSGERLRFRAPLPSDMAELIKALEFRKNN